MYRMASTYILFSFGLYILNSVLWGSQCLCRQNVRNALINLAVKKCSFKSVIAPRYIYIQGLHREYGVIRCLC